MSYPADHGSCPGRNKTSNVKQVIRKLVKQYGEHPYDINNGNCNDFAWAIAKRVKGVSVMETGNCFEAATPEERFNPPNDGPTHFFVKVGRRYYDAESPDGEIDWRFLPLFRKRAKGRKP